MTANCKDYFGSEGSYETSSDIETKPNRGWAAPQNLHFLSL